MTLEERNKFTGNVRSDVARLERLTNGLLELTSVEMSVANDEFCVLVDVEAACQHASLHGSTSTPIAIAAKNLTAILSHLIKNADQHGAKSIEITSVVVDQTLQIDITDDGDGVPESNKHLLFDPFFTTYRDQGGTGLGLSIAQAIARNADGDLEYVTRPMKTGTTFRLTVPLALPDGPEISSAHKAARHFRA